PSRMEVPRDCRLIGRMRPEQMRMYQAAERLLIEVDQLLPGARAAASRMADHLERSCDSVMFNMAEGIGSFTPKVKINAYDIARKEANEARAVLRRLMLRGVFTYAEIRTAHDLAGACVGMLTAAIKAIENRAGIHK